MSKENGLGVAWAGVIYEKLNAVTGGHVRHGQISPDLSPVWSLT